MIVYAVVDDALSLDFALGVELEVFVRREDGERFISGRQVLADLCASGQDPHPAGGGEGPRLPFR